MGMWDWQRILPTEIRFAYQVVLLFVVYMHAGVRPTKNANKMHEAEQYAARLRLRSWRTVLGPLQRLVCF